MMASSQHSLSSSSPVTGPSVDNSMRPRYTSCHEHHTSLSMMQQQSNSLSSTATLTPMAQSESSTVEGMVLQPARDHEETSPFLRLPVELRLQIYSLILLPSKPTDLLPEYVRIHKSAQDTFDYDKRQHGTDRYVTADLTRPTILIRTIDGTHYPTTITARTTKTNNDDNDSNNSSEQVRGAGHLRTAYSVRGDRFRARTMQTTYHSVNTSYLNTRNAASLLRTNRQIHSEAADLLYGSYTFDFDSHVEAIVPFLRDLTPAARACVRSLRFVKRALPYEKEFDRAEWSAALGYLASEEAGLAGVYGGSLARLELGVVAGRPGPEGWEDVRRYSAAEFGLLSEQEGMEWMHDLFPLLKGLRELEVKAIVEHCPPASASGAMERFVRFSASVEEGFAEYMKGLVGGLES